jgi:magnesium transporter
MRKIKYKKTGNCNQYTRIHWTSQKFESEMQLFVYDDTRITEYEDLDMSDFKKCISLEQNNWLNLLKTKLKSLNQ